MTSPPEDATTALTRHVLELDASALPEGVVAQARRVVADTLGVLCAASTKPAVRTAMEAVSFWGPCTVVGSDAGAAPEVAAFVNGIGGHDIELDDLHAVSRTHPASVVVPAALAAAQQLDSCQYGDLLAGIIGAYDVQVRLSNALGAITQYERGFHPSAVTGAVGAAVCAGRILALSADEMRSCIGLAASQSAGILTFYDDPFHMAKSFQTGIAARSGVTAALFARSGYHAAPDVLTGRNTMLKPFGGASADPDQLAAGLGERFEILFTTLKRHASCALTHAAVDATLDLLSETGMSADNISQIKVALPHASVPSVDNNVLWTHNIQYVLALAATQRCVTVEHFTPGWTEDQRIRALATRVEVAGDDDLQARFPEHNGAVVTLVTPDGTFVRERRGPRGSPVEPLTDAELSDKFSGLARTLLSSDGASRLWRAVTTTALDESLEGVLRPLSPVGSPMGGIT